MAGGLRLDEAGDEVPTFCRICESACGLVATVDGGKVLGLRPDLEHPVSRGYACLKGTRFAAVQEHKERVCAPLWRASPDRPWTTTGWNEVLGRLGSRLRDIYDDHGPDAIGVFSGNATVNSLGAILGVTALQRAFGTRKHYSALTLDNSDQLVVLDACLGNPMRTFVADYSGSDFVVLIGTDPLSSQASQSQSHPNAIRELLERAAAAQLVVVDPRRSQTAARAALHIRPRPGNDVELLGYLVREVIERTGGTRAHAVAAPADVEQIARAVAPFTAERVAAVLDVPGAVLADLAGRLLCAERPLVWSGLGVLLGPDGSVGYWLTLVLQCVLGGLARPGGWLQHAGAVDVPRLFGALGMRARDPRVRTRRGDYPAILGTLASATLADDVLTPGPERLRALIVVGGNPAVSLPDTGRAERALRSLELLICADLFVNDTGALAHAVLPARTWLEREDTNVPLAQMRRVPHLQLARPVVAARGDTRDDWTLLTDLCRAARRPLFGSQIVDALVAATGLGPTAIARAAVTLTAPFSWRALVRAPRGLSAPSRFATQSTLRGVLRLGVPELLDALAARSGGGAPSIGAPGVVPLQLITSVRPLETMNSWMHDTAAAARRAPRATLHPEELRRLGVPDGGRVRLRAPGDRDWPVEVEARADPGVRPGVVVLPYGWGHRAGAVGDGGRAGGGVNANYLVRTDHLEPFTGQPISNGAWIEASAAAGCA